MGNFVPSLTLGLRFSNVFGIDFWDQDLFIQNILYRPKGTLRLTNNVLKGRTANLRTQGPHED